MAVVVSDTTPLHYLVLVGRESVLESLYGKVVTPSAVLTELRPSAAPLQVSSWAAQPPAWVIVANPTSIPSPYDALDFGERQALAPAHELHADLILLDGKVARRAALQGAMKVKGTLGIVADAATANLLDFVRTVEQLQRTSMHLDQDVLDEVIRVYQRSRENL